MERRKEKILIIAAKEKLKIVKSCGEMRSDYFKNGGHKKFKV